MRAPVLKTFPFENVQLHDDGSVIEEYFCPPETDDGVLHMELASKHYYKLKYCLFNKKFQTNEKRICKKEAKPMFMELNDEKTNIEICGFTQYQTLHGLAYYVCTFHHLYTSTL